MQTLCIRMTHLVQLMSNADTFLLIVVHSLPQGSFLVLYILWVLTNV